MGFRDVFDFFGSVHVVEKNGEIILSGIDTSKLLADIDAIWRNKRVPMNMFKEIRKYRITFDSFFAADVCYQLEQIALFKKRKSHKFRIDQARELLLTETWLKSTTEEHEDILDFSQLNRLKFKLLPTQIETLQMYNKKVPRMQLKGFLLGTPPGCLAGDTQISFRRGGREFTLNISDACARYNQLLSEEDNWDLSIPTYVRSYDGDEIIFHQINSIVPSGTQEVFLTQLEDGNSIRCTAKHLFVTNFGDIPACDIAGKLVMCDDWSDVPHYVMVRSIESVGCEPTYDIICNGPPFNFSANDIIVHNSGKTLMSIALSICLHSDVTIFVVPKNTVTTVWYDGIIEQFGEHVRIWSSVRGEALTPDYEYYIFHYEALDKAIELARSLRGVKRRPFIAIDESHNLNEISSQRTLKLIEVSKTLDCQHTVFATGTPVKALGLEMVPLLRTIDRFFSPEVEVRFMKIYGATAKRANDILRNRLGLISHKIIESDYMKIPPPKEVEHLITIPEPDRFLIKNIKIELKRFMEERRQFYQKNMRSYTNTYNEGLAYYERTIKTPAGREEFKKYREYIKIIIEGYDPVEHRSIARFVKEMETGKIIPSLPQPLRNRFKDSLSVVKWMRLRVLGEALGHLSKIRGECAVELAKHGKLDEIVLNADKKTIIFSSFIPALEAGNKYFVDRGFKTLQVFGDSTKNIASIVNQFKTDPDTNPLFGTLQSLAASQTLTVANVVIFLDAPFREYIRNQAFHRVFRIGQTVQTHIVMCLLSTKEPNISNRSADILEWSQSQVDAIFGSATREEALGIVKQLRLNPPSGLDLLLDMMKKVNPF